MTEENFSIILFVLFVLYSLYRKNYFTLYVIFLILLVSLTFFLVAMSPNNYVRLLVIIGFFICFGLSRIGMVKLTGVQDSPDTEGVKNILTFFLHHTFKLGRDRAIRNKFNGIIEDLDEQCRNNFENQKINEYNENIKRRKEKNKDKYKKEHGKKNGSSALGDLIRTSLKKDDK